MKILIKFTHSKWAASWETRIFAYAKTKAQISFAVTAKLISAFVFATRIVQFLFYLNPKLQASSSFLSLYRPVCVGPGRKPRRPVFSRRGSNSSSYETHLQLTQSLNTLWHNQTKAFSDRFSPLLLLSRKSSSGGFGQKIKTNEFFTQCPCRIIEMYPIYFSFQYSMMPAFKVPQTHKGQRLYKHRRWLQAWNFGFRK